VFYNTPLINPENILKAGKANFERIVLTVFQYQYNNNPIYRQYCEALHTDIQAVNSLPQIPFLPVSFFKTHKVVTGPADTDTSLVFESSGTTGTVNSRHFIADAAIYEKSLLQGFEQYYGPAQQYAILALLPSYLQRKNASLVYMARTLMEKSAHPENGFYIDEWQQLHETVKRCEQAKQKVLLLGVTFALLDFAAAYPMHLEHTIIMETGGMKGRREELTRSEVHAFLKKQFGVVQVHSEYGMTELLSQAYSKADGIFSCTNTMRVLVHDINDPLEVKETGSGALNIIDLANLYSCSFVATEDIGNVFADGAFEVLGRLDNSALRGCSLMAV